ncbi:MAG TPA: hypothetical protein PKN99_12310 [Cyclobacteriaceae bacterium]|nr:hypothetical protein [Cyclobacteriaceae bacterium]
MANFFRNLEPKIKDTTLNWRIYELVRQGILERISRGQFRFGEMKVFTPSPAKTLIKLNREISLHFPFAQLCIWETGWLNDFAQHISNKSIIILETEREVCESVFYKLQDASKAVFLEPTLEVMERYVSVEKVPIVIKPMVSEAPLQVVGGINFPTLEKILVDLVCDREILFAYQGRELNHIWKNAFSRYTVLQDKLLRYADRRARKPEVLALIRKTHNSAAI